MVRPFGGSSTRRLGFKATRVNGEGGFGAQGAGAKEGEREEAGGEVGRFRVVTESGGVHGDLFRSEMRTAEIDAEGEKGLP